MKRLLIPALSAVLAAAIQSFAPPTSALEPVKPDMSWQNVISNVLARPGSIQPGDVYTVGIPRTDLRVTVRGVTLEPSFALTSYQNFRSTGKGAEIQLKGDLLLLPDEVNPVMSRLMKGGMQITALHNHLMGENPRLMDLHFGGSGAAGTLASVLRDALALTASHLYPNASELLEENLPSDEVQGAFKQVQQILGQEGTIARHVLQVHVARKDPIRSGNADLPPAMGTCICMAFQGAGPGEVAATGELAVIQDELMPVLQALRMGDLEVSAIHDSLLGETPALKYVHFWGRGSAEKVATGLRAALDQIALKR
jgi:uncharacterized protein DUF1259